MTATCPACSRPVAQGQTYHIQCEPDERIERLETGLLKLREIALACCRASDVATINEITKEAFASERGG